MNSIIENSLENSFSYQEYRSHVTQLAKENKTTGHEQREDLIHYTQLNETRLNRLDKTIQITDEVNSFLKNLKKEYIWLVISESWCGDAAQILPIMNKMAIASGKINLRIVLRDDNEDLMNQFLTNGTKSIPKLIIIDKETNSVITDFGPRPKAAKQLILDYKAAHGSIDETAKIELQKWYLNDKGISTQKEIVDLMQDFKS
ncbi:thioredoxin family protein [Flavobacterium sp. SUN052]|uniref:thioredoxin family protein n=1 Tax=Flavobacterium sp. SUN052 TaxID=3002441 RepID=UPI00237D5817|nr:thioredoxin family protein [Flavobacterium sp. SUN052]MEC4004077.1 thioredoxin family protein [Flavobacterium sp. SUN052]